MGLGFASSSSVLNHVLRHLRDRSPLGWVGTHVQDMAPALASAFGIRGRERTIATVVRAWPNLYSQAEPLLPAKDAQAPIQSPDLGILLPPVTDAARKPIALGDANRVAVVAVDNQSEAYSKGVRSGDVIEKVQDTAVTAPRDFLRLVQEAAGQNEAVALLVRRKVTRPYAAGRRGEGGAAAPELR
jgi:S1-C subfamily serine protease